MDTIGRYQIVEKLGHGGMGTVYKAFDPLLARVVAIKIISTHLDSGPEHRERFFREARAAAHLSHRNIITVHDLGEHEGSPFLAMEYLQGRDLDHLMKSVPLPLSRKLEIALDTCQGLCHAHAQGIVHRDIKPANIFITDGGEVKILDFGLARLVTSDLTHSNMMLGTVNYMAPEQIRAERADHRADIFSLGVVLYEMLSGHKAFEGDSFVATMYKILQESPERPSVINPTLPPVLDEIVERAMAKSRDERYQDVLDLVRDLEPVLESLDSDAGRHSTRSGSDTRPPSGQPAPGSSATGAAHGSASSRARTLAGAPLAEDFDEQPTQAVSLPPLSRAGTTPRPGSAPPVAGEAVPPARRSWIVAASAAAAVLAIVIVGWLLVRPRGAGETPAPPGTTAPGSGTTASKTPSAPEPPSPSAAPGAPDREPRATDGQTGGSDETPQTADAAVDEALNRARQRARAALEAGRISEAGRAAAEALALDPRDKEATAIIASLASRAQQQGARDALAQLETARRRAIAANARELARDEFASAERQEASARELLRKEQWAPATAMLYTAATAFRNATTAATLKASEQHSAARAAEPREGEPRSGPAPEPPRPAPSVEVAPAPAERTPAPPAERAAPPRAEPVQLPTPPSGPNPQEAITAVLQRYAAALEHKDLAALKAVWPTLAGSQLAALQSEFENARSIEVALAPPRIEVSGATASARTVRTYMLRTRDGQRLETKTAMTVALHRSGSGWVIDSIRFEPMK